MRFRKCLDAGMPTSGADFALHLSIAEATNNLRFRDFCPRLDRVSYRARPMGSGESEVDQSAYIVLIDEEHRQIVAAISTGDEEEPAQQCEGI